MAVELPFETEIDKADAEPSFLVEVDGFEGPLDLLLELARRQKVDLHKISILALAEQYLLFVEEARKVRLELAADYLVMAAWLAYLKSRLMLPEPPKGEEPAAADLAAALALRLRRLEAIRNVAEQLINRPRFGRDWQLNGTPEGITVQKTAHYRDTIYDLLAAYAKQRQIQALSKVTLRLRHVWSIPEARAALERLAGMALDSPEQLLLTFGSILLSIALVAAAITVGKCGRGVRGRGVQQHQRHTPLATQVIGPSRPYRQAGSCSSTSRSSSCHRCRRHWA